MRTKEEMIKWLHSMARVSHLASITIQKEHPNQSPQFDSIALNFEHEAQNFTACANMLENDAQSYYEVLRNVRNILNCEEAENVEARAKEVMNYIGRGRTIYR
jgi:hypothetical protein